MASLVENTLMRPHGWAAQGWYVSLTLRVGVDDQGRKEVQEMG